MTRESITSSVNTGVAKRRAATHYGRRLHEREALAVYEQENGQVVMETTFTYDKLVNFVLSDKLYNYLPAGVRVLSAQLMVTVAFAGGTSLKVGTYDVTTGAAVDDDGLITDANAPLASLGAKAFVQGSGAQLNTAAGLAADYNVKAVATGTFTAGEATLRIVFQRPVDRFAPLNG